MLTEKKLKEKQHIFTLDCISTARDKYFVNDKVNYRLFIFKCDEKELYFEVDIAERPSYKVYEEVVNLLK